MVRYGRCWHWAGGNDMMMLGGARSLSVGCGSQPAIWLDDELSHRLDDELSHGLTSGCQTFGNTPLTTEEKVMALSAAEGGEGGEHPTMQANFTCVAVELYVLV
ncbi:hypothetical protein T484DRAFT_1773895 [Baffinella frigidus]|nr:hypothetical protein T484DRAFT_1773895 [Cryptophyta sp. CCMP2293]